MRWFAPTLAAIALGGCLVPIGDVDPDNGPGDDGGAGAGGAGGATGGSAGGAAQGGNAGSAGSGGAAGGVGGTAGSGATGGSAGAGDAQTPIFSDDFSNESANWVALGGAWTIADGEAVQASSDEGFAVFHVPSVSPADCRIRAKMRQIGTNNHISGAVEIAFRIEATKPTLYHCNWEPNDGRIVIQYLDGASAGVILEKFVTLPAGYDTQAWFTMEMTIVAGQIQCRILELPGSELTVPASPLFAAGSVGLKTWRMAGAFDYFEVYPP